MNKQINPVNYNKNLIRCVPTAQGPLTGEVLGMGLPGALCLVLINDILHHLEQPFLFW